MHKSLKSKLWISGVTTIGIVAFLYPFFMPPTPSKGVDVAPQIDYAEVPDFSVYTDVIEKKKAFFEYLKPVVEEQNQSILNQRNFIIMAHDDFVASGHDAENFISDIDKRKLRSIASQYRVDSSEINETFFMQLIQRVDAIPMELVLVQAANESAWGTSRFARKGFNFFGMWCFKKGCGFVPLRRDDDMSHEVAKYDSLEEGVAKYMNTLNRHSAYKDLRYIRKVLRNTQQPITAELLAEGLLHYSERGQAYVEELQAMIRVNRKHMGLGDSI